MKFSRSLLLLMMFSFLFTLGMLLDSKAVFAANIYVNSPVDSGPAAPGFIDVACNLRDAVLASNKNQDGNGCFHSNGPNSTVVGAYGDDVIILDRISNPIVLKAQQGELTISGNVTIQGKNKLGLPTTIDGNSAIRIFHIDESNVYNVFLYDVNVINGKAASIGGAILNSGDSNLTLNATTFSNNTALDGGAIYNGNGDLTINNSTFTNNSSSKYNGGAIYTYVSAGKSLITIDGSTFSNNMAKINYGGNGGAIYNMTHGVGTAQLTVSNSIFDSNSGFEGGAIYNFDEGSGNNVLAISASDFTNNTAMGDGGAVYGGVISIADSTFSKNIAIGLSGSGGAVASYYMPNAYISAVYQLDITDCSFVSNSSTHGAAVVNDGLSRIQNSIFSDNTKGPAIQNGYISPGGESLVIDNSNFDSNANNGGLLLKKGGAILNRHATILLQNSTFKDNSSDNGGAIYNDHGNVSIDNSNFTDNSSLVSGGAIYNDVQSQLGVFSSTFTGNVSLLSGGAIENNEYATIYTSTFTGNSAQYGGGISTHTTAGSNSDLTIQNSTFSDNYGAESGSDIITNKTPVYISSSTFRNTVALSGSSLWADGIIYIAQTLLASSNPGFSNCAVGGGSIQDWGNNLQYGDASCGATITQSVKDPFGQNVLSDNGGPTQTIALSPTSEAIDTVDAAPCIGNSGAQDQRGVARPYDGDGDGVSKCDVGAYEYYPGQ